MRAIKHELVYLFYKWIKKDSGYYCNHFCGLCRFKKDCDSKSTYDYYNS